MTTRQRYLTARIAYVAIVLLATLANLHFSSNADDALMRLGRAVAPSIAWRDAIDGLRNAVLFAGLGAVWVLTSLSNSIPRELRWATLTSFALSTLVEGFQVFSPVRTASILDVFTNTLGGLAGALVIAMLLVSLQKAKRDKSYVGIPTLLIAGPYVLALICEALSPLFESDPLRFMEGGPLNRLSLALSASLPLDWNEIQVLDIPLYVAGGFLLVALLRERKGASSLQWIGVTIVGTIVVTLAHMAHGLFGLPVRWEAVITDSLSIAVGARLAGTYLNRLSRRYRTSERARLAIFTYLGLLAVWGWRPLFPETDWDAILAELETKAFIPLARLSERVDVFSALHVAQQFLLYLPLGALLAVWPLRLTGRWSGLRPAVVFTVVIEAGHIVMSGRTFDVTNILLACAGLAVGWVAVRRSGYQPYGSALHGATSRTSRRS